MLTRSEIDIYFNSCIEITKLCNRIIDEAEQDADRGEIRRKVLAKLDQIESELLAMKKAIVRWETKGGK
jgi:hypothetical protein